MFTAIPICDSVLILRQLHMVAYLLNFSQTDLVFGNLIPSGCDDFPPPVALMESWGLLALDSQWGSTTWCRLRLYTPSERSFLSLLRPFRRRAWFNWWFPEFLGVGSRAAGLFKRLPIKTLNHFYLLLLHFLKVPLCGSATSDHVDSWHFVSLEAHFVVTYIGFSLYNLYTIYNIFLHD